MLTHNDYVAFVHILWELLHMDAAPDPQWWPEVFCSVLRQIETDDAYELRSPALRHLRCTPSQVIEPEVSAAWQAGEPVGSARGRWYPGRTRPTIVGTASGNCWPRRSGGSARPEPALRVDADAWAASLAISNRTFFSGATPRGRRSFGTYRTDGLWRGGRAGCGRAWLPAARRPEFAPTASSPCVVKGDKKKEDKKLLNLLFALLTMYHPFEETSMGGSHRHFSKSVLPFAITLLMVISGRAAGAGLTLSHSSMVLNTVQGVKNYTSQSLGVSAATLTSYTVSLSTSTGGNWLSISPGTGILNTVMNPYLIVAADATGLGPGYYFGQVTVTASGATLTVFVVLAVDIATRAGIVGIIASPSSVSLTATPNTSATANVILTTTSSSALSYSLTSATIPLGGHWLGGAGTSLSVSSTSSSTVEIVANATGLSAGTYYAVVQVWPSNGAAGTTIPVTFTVTASGTGNITVTANNAAGPPSLAFAYVTGGATPAVQTLQILSTSGSAPVAFTVSSSASWLSAGVSSGNSLNTPVDNPGLPISVNPSGLTASPTPYSAAITITPTGGTVVTVPVTLTVQPAPSVTVSPTTLTFAYQMGAANPSPATINVSGGGQALGFAVQVTSGSSWLSVAPATGTTPVTGTIALTVTANPKDAGLTATTYIGSILVTGRDTAINSTSIMVTLSVTAPLPAIAKIVNAASGAEGVIVPGEIVAIFAPAGGNNPIGPATAVGLTLDQDGKVSTSLGGVQVLFNGTPAPLTYVSAAQVNAVVPYEIRGVLSSTVWVKFQGQSSQQLSLQTAVAAPGIFTANGSGTGPGAIANGDGSTNSPSNPSPKGGIVVLYVTGEGYTSPIAVTGKVTTISSTGPLTPQPLVPMGITIDGQPADVTFWGEAPGFVAGVMQVNVRIPANVRSGDLPMIVSIGGNSSQSGVTVSVQ